MKVIRGVAKLIFLAGCSLLLLIVSFLLTKRFTRIWFQMINRLLCKSLGVRILHTLDKSKSSPLESIGTSGTLIMANHVSYLDAVVLSALFPCTFVAKSEVGSWPLVGALSRRLGVLFLKRASLSHRVSLVKRLKTRLSQDSVLVFPEGTTTDETTPQQHNWKHGQIWSAAQAKAKVTLVGIHYENQRSMAWIGDTKLVPHLWNFLCGSGVNVYVSIMEFENIELLSSLNNREKSNFFFKKLCLLCENSQSEAYLCQSNPVQRSQVQLHSLI